MLLFLGQDISDDNKERNGVSAEMVDGVIAEVPSLHYLADFLSINIFLLKC